MTTNNVKGAGIFSCSFFRNTTNINFNKWGDVFSDNVIANAILDRLLHHSTVIPIQGTSYRIKEAMINAILEEFILIKSHKKLLTGGNS